MPTYDYECDDCGHAFEIFQSMTAAKRRTCPECGGRVRRLIGLGAGVVFKGSGFYETDYRSADYKKKQKSESGGEKGAESKSSGEDAGAGSKGADKSKKPSGSSGKTPGSSPE